jgi:subtilisin family serine protease
MSEQTKDQSPHKQTAQPTASGPKLASPEQPKSAWDNGAAGTVGSRKPQYLIGSRSLPGIAPVPTELIVHALEAMAEVEIVRRLRPRKSPTPSDGGLQSGSEIIVARMDEAQGEALRRNAAPNLVIEADELLYCADATHSGLTSFGIGGQPTPLPCRGKDLRFRVVGEGDRPLAGARVFVFGSGLPAQAVTDESGHATVTFFDQHNGAVGGLVAAHALYVKPAADHWERFIADPALGEGANLIRLRPFSQTFSNFPAERLVGWGQRMMKLDQLPDGLDGAGVKIGLIASGCDNSHPLLRHVTHGFDVMEPGKANGWATDPIGHGTHCAGIIAAGSGSRTGGVRGFAPGAELHVFKLLPGGRFSDLIEALDECIERQIDVAHISVGCGQRSELVALKLAEASQRGVACIVAAGASSGLPQFPANEPTALAVAAVGKIGEFPPDSHHARIALGRPVGADGLFVPEFGDYGLQAPVRAPGVAIVSTVPGGGYAAWDGASMAAAHVTGFAALLLAHFPLFHGAYATRGEHRVAALFETIRAASDRSGIGGGLTDLQRVPGWTLPVPRAVLTQPPETIAGGPIRHPLQTGWPPPPAYLADPVLMQLRALGMI